MKTQDIQIEGVSVLRPEKLPENFQSHGETKFNSLAYILSLRARQQSHKNIFTFLFDEDKPSLFLTYGQLDEKALAVASRLRESLKPGSRVLLLFPPCLDFIPAFFGCLYAGMIAVPAYPPKNNRHLGRLSAILQDSQAGLALTHSGSLSKIRNLFSKDPALDTLSCVATDQLPSKGLAAFPLYAAEPRDLAFLQYTSGSTGTAKGVMVSHGNLIHNLSVIREQYHHTEASVMISWLPVFHDLGLIAGVLQPLFTGFPAVIMAPNTFLQRPRVWLETITRFAGTSTLAPNFAYDLCVNKITPEEIDGLDLSSLKVALNAAEPIRAKTIIDFSNRFSKCGFKKEAFFPGYGLAEGTLHVSFSPFGRGPMLLDVDAQSLEEDQIKIPNGEKPARTLVGSGVVPDEIEVLVVEPKTFEPRAEDEIGEIWTAGLSVAKGYWKKEKESKETFEGQVSGPMRGRYLRTGDLGFIHQNELFITGRLKDLIIIRGANHYPQDVELSMEKSHGDLRPNCGAAFSVEVEGEERVVIVHEVERNRERQAPDIFQAARKALLSDHDITPCALVLIKPASLPKTSSGKIQRRATKKKYLEGQLEIVAQWKENTAADPMGAVLAADEACQRTAGKDAAKADIAWLREKVALKIRISPEKINPKDTLASLGLDSLGIMELKAEVDRGLGVNSGLDLYLEEYGLDEISSRLAGLPKKAAPKTGFSGPEGELSSGQKGLWFYQKLNPESCLYNVPTAWNIDGELDTAALRDCLETIVKRHDGLSLGVREVGGLPKTFWRPGSPLDWSYEETRDEAVCASRMEIEAAKPFDISKPPLLRARIYKLGPGRHRLLLVAHHLVVDGWSVKVIWQEMKALYQGKLIGQVVPLPELPLKFSQWATSAYSRGSEASLEYWIKRHENPAPQLQLPSDRPRPARQSNKGGCLSFDIGSETAAEIRKYGRSLSVTPFATLLAAFQTLLFRLSGQQDQCLGIPAANRDAPGCGALAGFFVNTLALRQKLEPEQSFESLAGEVKKEVKEALLHQDAPFEKLVDALKIKPDLGRHPLFQAMFVYQGANAAPGNFGAAVVKPLDVNLPAAKFDLALSVEEREQGLHAVFEYSSDLFDASTIQRWAGHFQTLLAGALRDPKQSLSSLPLLDAQEKHRLLNKFNDTAIEFPKDLCAHQLFERQARQTPEASALRFAGSVMTYAELDARSNTLANALRAWGVGPDVLVGLCCDRSFEMVVGLLGVLKAGGAYVPLDPSYPQDRLAFMAQDAGFPILLTQQKITALVPKGPFRVFCLDSEWMSLSFFEGGHPNPEVKPDNLAYVIYTSGSTGKPKGVMLRHQGLVNLALAEAGLLEISRESRVLQFASASFDASVWEIFGAFAGGASLVLADKARLVSPDEAAKIIRQERVSVATLPPTLLANLDPQELTGLKTVVSAGESCPPELARRWSGGRRFINAYGPTETTVCATMYFCDTSLNAAPPIGKPIPNMKVYILDQKLQPQPIGIPGEIFIGGVGVARGYKNRPELNVEKFLVDPFSKDSGTTMYKSGDLGCWLPGGNIQYLGRIDNQVKVRGFRVELEEVEAALTRIEGVKEAAVCLKSGPDSGQMITAYLVVKGPLALEGQEIRGILAKFLPQFMLPSAFVFLPQLPLSVNGKVDRKALPDPAPKDRSKQGDVSEPRDAREAALVKAFKNVLGLESLGIDESFFELGGHSLLAAKLASEIGKQMGVHLELAKIFENPTVEGLAKCLPENAGFYGRESGLARYPEAERKNASCFQESLWFFDQISAVKHLYNMPLALRLRGNLDVFALKQAVRELFIRHETLRSGYYSDAGKLLVRASAARFPCISQADLSAVPAEDREEVLRRVVQDESERPFDLESGLVFRVTLVKTGEDEHLLLIASHHIASDGWSLGVILKELKALYEALCRHEAPDLPAKTLDYQDWAAWHREKLAHGRMENQMDWWKNQLAGIDPVLDFPADRARPLNTSFQGGTVRFPLPQDTPSKVEALSRESGATPFMIMLATFQVFLSRISEKEDLVCGIPVANRGLAEAGDMVGFFVNTLPIRFRTQGNPSFLEALAQVRKTCLEAFAHCDLPFEKIVEGMKIGRLPGTSPLVQAVFAMQQAVGEGEKLGGTLLEPYALASRSAKFDLTLFVEESSRGMEGILEFNADLFDRATAGRLAGQWAALAGAALRNPHEAVSCLPLMNEAEKKTILETFNFTATEYPRQARVHELFEEQALLRPEAVAVSFQGRQVSYAQLNTLANQYARRLAGQGIPHGTPVGLMAERNLEMLAGMLGILKAGCAYVPLDPSYPRERIEFMIRDTDAPAILCQEKYLPLLGPLAGRALCLDRLEKARDSSPLEASNPVSPGNAESLAYIMYTSGSTGTPKGVCIPHRGIVRLVKNNAYLQLGPEDVVAQASNHSFDAATFEIWGALCNGARLELIPKEAVISPKEFAHLIKIRRVNTLWLTAALFNLFAKENPQGLSALDNLLVGGDVLDPRWIREVLQKGAPKKLINGYGPTENTTFSCCHLIRGADAQMRSIPIGRPISNTQAYILDAQGNPAPVGIPGELFLGGDGLALGYWKRPELTAEKFVPNPFEPGKNTRLYRSGDKACWRADGTIEFLGRLDNQVKVRGYRVELGEIEAALCASPGVGEAAVLALKNSEGDLRLAAYIVPKTGENPVAEGLRKGLKILLPDYMIPAQWAFLPEFPINPNGKLDRKALAATPLEAEQSMVKDRGRNTVEQELLRIWEDLLNLNGAGATDNFFELGGHSLLAVRAVSEIRKSLGLELTLADFFRAATPRDLAALLGKSPKEKNQEEILLVPVQEKGNLRPIFLVHPIGGSAMCYLPLAGLLGPRQPVFGLQAPGMEGKQPPLDRVDALAAAYIKEIKKVQPQGPYFLGGWSFGGVVAFEMARQLAGQGEKTEFLALFDSQIPSALEKERFEKDPLFSAELFVNDLAGLRQFEMEFPGKEFLRVGEENRDDFLESSLSASVQLSLRDVKRLHKVFQAHARALMNYHPGSYAGRITAFVAGEGREGKRWQEAISWGQWANGVDVRAVPGNHYSMWQEPGIKVLAERLQTSLRESPQFPLALPERALSVSGKL